MTLLYGVLFGEDIPDVIGVSVPTVLVNSSGLIIAYDKHTGSPIVWQNFADMICYRALDEFRFGNQNKACDILRSALSMWNGLGFYDDASRNDGFYANFKIGLFLYVADILYFGLKSDIRSQMVNRMWSMQNNSTGGIVSLADLDGNPIGSCNCEVTSFTLLPYILGSESNNIEVGAWYANPTILISVVVGFCIVVFGLKKH